MRLSLSTNSPAALPDPSGTGNVREALVPAATAGQLAEGYG